MTEMGPLETTLESIEISIDPRSVGTDSIYHGFFTCCLGLGFPKDEPIDFKKIRITTTSEDEGYFENIRQDLESTLEAYLSPSHMISLEIAIEELYINAVIHGNDAGSYGKREDTFGKGCPDGKENYKKKVVLDLLIAKDAYCLIVTDEGKGIDEDHYKAKCEEPHNIEDKLPGVKGLIIVRKQSDYFDMERIEDGFRIYAGRFPVRPQK